MKRRSTTYLLVALMGFVGASMRYGLELLFAGATFPYATLCINIFGCFTIEIVNNFIGRRLHVGAGLTRAMGVGLVGAFTTLSAFCNESLELLMTGDYVLFGLYVAGTFILCYLSALAGHYVTKAMAARRLNRLRQKRKKRNALREESQPSNQIETDEQHDLHEMCEQREMCETDNTLQDGGAK